MQYVCDNTRCFLAYACVPMQEFNETYTPEDGLECGTIFPELNLPINVYIPKTCQEGRK